MDRQSLDIRSESHDDGMITGIVLDRGNKKNAFSPAMAAELKRLLDLARTDRSRIIVIRSAVEQVFSAGFDITFLGTDQAEVGQQALYDSFAVIETAEKITVAIADGIVMGGGNELFLSCDFRLATQGTVFRLTPARLSLIYSLEGMARFVSVIGPTAAMEMFVAARQLTAEEALRIGLVTRIVRDRGEAMAYCRELLSSGPLAQRAMKQMIRQLADWKTCIPTDPAIVNKFEALREAANHSMDRKEAIKAFSEKRAPIFKGE